MGWLTGDRAAKGMLVPINDGTQNFISIPPFGVGRENNQAIVYQDGSYSNYATTGYGRNELVYACIRYRAESFPQAVLRVYPQGRGEAIDDHRLRQLFANPNPVTSEFEFFELSSTYKDIAGTCFWLIVRGRDGLPSELWPLRPDLVGVLPGNTYQRNGWPNYIWTYTPDPRRPEVIIGIDPADMIRIRYPNPNPNDPGARWFGQPPLRAAARAVTLDNAATDFVDSTLRNHAMPAAVIESEAEITSALHERLQAFWRKAFSNSNPRRGVPAFLQKGMKVHELGLTMTNLEFPDLRAVAESRICMAFGVEPILVGTKLGLEHNAYKDYKEARLSFWEESMVTEQRRFIEPIKAQLLPAFQGVGRRAVRLDWDVSGVPSLKESQQVIWDRAIKGLQGGGITVNDFRFLVGLPDIGPSGDVFLTPAGVTSSPIGAERPAPQLEAAQQVAQSMGLLAAEFGMELTDEEMIRLPYIGENEYGD